MSEIKSNFCEFYDEKSGDFSSNLVKSISENAKNEVTMTLEEAMREIKILAENVEPEVDFIKLATVYYTYNGENHVLKPDDLGINNWEFEKISSEIMLLLSKAGCSNCQYSGFLD